MKMHGITMLRCSSDVQWRFAYQEAEEKKTVKSSSFHLPPLMKSVEDLSQNKKPRILLALINRQNKRSPHQTQPRKNTSQDQDAAQMEG